tara:strand:- start:5848 stop:6381 length:534 start_codon:yes stop_codon:yes gene_type:complete
MSSVETSAPVPDTPTFSPEGKTLGRVKWFNNKTGYGFITSCDCDKESMDVFVHHSQITVATQQYKYLVEGEYVHFTLSDSTNNEHKHIATGVSGINGGNLMCETRNMQQEARTNIEGSEGGRGRGGGGGRGRGGGGGGGGGGRGGGRGGSFRTYNSDQYKLVRRNQSSNGEDYAEEI